MKRALAILLFASTVAAANVSGLWTGAFRVANAEHDVPQLFTLKQDGDKITGTGGPDSTEQYPISHGEIAGDAVKFVVKTAKREFIYDLKNRNQELRGSLVIKSAEDTRTAEVWLRPVH